MTLAEIKTTLEADGHTVNYLIDPSQLPFGYQSDVDYHTHPSTELLVRSRNADEFRVTEVVGGIFRLTQLNLARDGIFDQTELGTFRTLDKLSELMRSVPDRMVA